MTHKHRNVFPLVSENGEIYNKICTVSMIRSLILYLQKEPSKNPTGFVAVHILLKN